MSNSPLVAEHNRQKSRKFWFVHDSHKKKRHRERHCPPLVYVFFLALSHGSVWQCEPTPWACIEKINGRWSTQRPTCPMKKLGYLWEHREKKRLGHHVALSVSMNYYKIDAMIQGLLSWKEEEEENGRWRRWSTRKSNTLDNATGREECNVHGPWSEKGVSIP